MHKFKNFIGEYSGLLSKEFCETLIRTFEDNPQFKVIGETVSGVNKEIKDSTDMGIYSNDPFWKDVDNTLYHAYSQAFNLYSEDSAKKWKDFPHTFKRLTDTGYIIQSYDINGKYARHIDGSDGTAFAGIVYLNPNDYTGGETEFPYHDCRIKPSNPGTIVIFPAGFPYIHEGLPVISGKKYIVTTFFVKQFS